MVAKKRVPIQDFLSGKKRSPALRRYYRFLQKAVRRALVYFSTLLGRFGRAPLSGEVGIPPCRADYAEARVGPQGRSLSSRLGGDAGPRLSDLGRCPPPRPGRAPGLSCRVSPGPQRQLRSLPAVFPPERRLNTPGQKRADGARPPRPRQPARAMPSAGMKGEAFLLAAGNAAAAEAASTSGEGGRAPPGERPGAPRQVALSWRCSGGLVPLPDLNPVPRPPCLEGL